MKYLSILAMLTLTVSAPTFANAQTESQAAQTQTRAQQAPIKMVAGTAKTLGIRLTDWKTMHSGSDAEAQETIATLKRIGCEVATENHGNHIDVRYRCPEWKPMKLATDQLVNQWSTWCASKGMETVAMNPPANTQKATVKFRMPTPKTVHLHDATKASQIVNTLSLIGCQVTTNQHGDHMDTTYSAPNWITIELQTDANAHAWQNWLNESGFETQHTH